MKYATFTWSTTVKVPDSFPALEDAYDKVEIWPARHEAWNNVHESDGELTDIEDVDDEPRAEDFPV